MIEYIGKCLVVDKKILVIGDLHLGYEEGLNKSGVFVSRNLFEEVLDELREVSEKINNVEEVVLLGDVKDYFGGILRQEWNDVESLFDFLLERCKRIKIVKGNHDNILEPIVRGKKNIELKKYYIKGRVCFMHGDKDFVENYDKKVKVWVLGHGHPAVKIKEPKGSKIEKYKCFLEGKYKGKEVIIVPSFFQGMEGSDPRESDLGMAWDFNLKKFRVMVVGEKLEVFDFGELGRL